MSNLDCKVENSGCQSCYTDKAPKKIRMKRMTIDIRADLHQKIKMKAVVEGKSMVDLIRVVLEREFAQDTH